MKLRIFTPILSLALLVACKEQPKQEQQPLFETMVSGGWKIDGQSPEQSFKFSLQRGDLGTSFKYKLVFEIEENRHCSTSLITFNSVESQDQEIPQAMNQLVGTHPFAIFFPKFQTEGPCQLSEIDTMPMSTNTMAQFVAEDSHYSNQILNIGLDKKEILCPALNFGSRTLLVGTGMDTREVLIGLDINKWIPQGIALHRGFFTRQVHKLDFPKMSFFNSDKKTSSYWSISIFRDKTDDKINQAWRRIRSKFRREVDEIEQHPIELPNGGFKVTILKKDELLSLLKLTVDNLEKSGSLNTEELCHL